MNRFNLIVVILVLTIVTCASADELKYTREHAVSKLTNHGVRVRRDEIDGEEITRVFFGCHRCPGFLLRELKYVPDVQILNLRLADDVTSEDLSVLRSLVNLNELLIHHCPFDDESVAHLQSLTNLRVLQFSSTSITDEGLKLLGEMKNLEKLKVNGEGITDRGADHIEKLTNLKELGLQNTSITSARLKKLRAALPNTRISVY